MERMRRPFQGVTNIIRFNWHFYVLAAILIGLCWMINGVFENKYSLYATLVTGVVSVPILISVVISAYVYDISDLYAMPWLDGIVLKQGGRIVNINAGLDEFSMVLKKRFPEAMLDVFDFYDPAKHTEVSIRRARKAYPAFPGTVSINTVSLPLPDDSSDLIILALAAHEIRNVQERVSFFEEIRRVVRLDGFVMVTEHLRDVPNFLAYTIGFFHFLSLASWLRVFRMSGLHVSREVKSTPFITTFILTKNGAAS